MKTITEDEARERLPKDYKLLTDIAREYGLLQSSVRRIAEAEFKRLLIKVGGWKAIKMHCEVRRRYQRASRHSRKMREVTEKAKRRTKPNPYATEGGVITDFYQWMSYDTPRPVMLNYNAKGTRDYI